MTPAELTAARATLGERWGYGRPIYASELGRILRRRGRDPGSAVTKWERGTRRVPGTVALAIELMLAGAVPAGITPGKPTTEA